MREADKRSSLSRRWFGWRTRRLGFGLLAATIAIATFFASISAAFWEWHDIELNGQCYGVRVFGDRVQVIVDAQSHPWRLPDSAAKVVNVRSYLVTARLTDDKNVKATRTVAGPLYTVGGPVSGLSISAGARFTKEDRKALAEQPFFSFTGAGDLLKTTFVDDGRNIQDLVLRVEGKTARWSKLPKRKNPPFLGWPNDNYFESQSRRYAVQKEPDGVVHIYELQTSRQIEDPWLKAVATEYLSRDDLGNSNAELTEDLNFLVLFPRPYYQLQRNDTLTIIEDFTIDGKKMRRANHFLVYQRPNQRPQVYEGSDFGLTPVVVAGKLRLLKTLDDRLEIQDLEKRVVLSHRLTAEEKWIANSFTQLDGGQGPTRVIFTHGPDRISSVNRGNPATIRVATWDYVHDKLSQFSIPVGDLFEVKSRGYYPREAIPVTD